MMQIFNQWTILSLFVVAMVITESSAGRMPLRKEQKHPVRTLQMIGAANPRMLHRISADLQPDTSKVVHIQVPYYIDRPKVRTKKFKPWIPRGHRFISTHSASHPQLPFAMSFHGGDIPLPGKPPIPAPVAEFPGASSGPGPYDTPFVPVMKPSPVNPLHPPEQAAAPEIMFEPISIVPLEAPSFATLRNHVNYLRQKQQAFFDGQGREFGYGTGDGGEAPQDGGYSFAGHSPPVHDGDIGEDGRNTLSEDDFGQNDRKYDRRGKLGPVEQESAEAEEEDEEETPDFFDTEGREFGEGDEDFDELSREEADRVAAFEPKKVYTQVRHRETVRHVPRWEEPVEERRNEEEDEEEDHRGPRDNEQDDAEDDEEDNEEDDEEKTQEPDPYEAPKEEDSPQHRPIRERVKEHRKNIVYSEKGREAQKFDHGARESFGEFEEKETPRRRKPARRNRIKRSEDAVNQKLPEVDEKARDEVVDVLAWMILGNSSDLPHTEALTDPRELHGEELLRFLDEAIRNTTQYLPPEPGLEGGDVISIVSPPSNVVKFPYYNRPASEIDVDSALRYAENLTTFSAGPYAPGKAGGGVECNEVDVQLEEEPEPIGGDGAGDGAADSGFRPIKRLQGLGDKIDCLRAKHFGSDPLDNPLFREEFVGGPAGTRKVITRQPQPNPAVAVYNDVIRHIKKHLASRKNSKSDTEQDTVMIAVPRVLRLDANGDAADGRQFTIDVGKKREPRLVFPQANPLPVSNHISVPIFDISKYVPRFMMRANDDLFADELHGVPDSRRPNALPLPAPSKPKVRLQALVKTAEQLAEGAVAVEEGVERQLTTVLPPVRDDIADAFDDVITKRPDPPAPLPPIHQYSVVEHQDSKDGDAPQPTYNKSGPPYAALALEPPVAQSILKQRIAPLERNQLDFHKKPTTSKGRPTTKGPSSVVRKTRRPAAVTRKKVLVFYH